MRVYASRECAEAVSRPCRSHAGKLAPARVLVLGAGVAGLAAIQTAKNMGAVVLGYDVRPVVKEQVSDSA